MLNINLHHINWCFNITLPLFTCTNLVYVNVNIGIGILNEGPSKNLVFTPSVSIRINTVCTVLSLIVAQGGPELKISKR